MIVPIVNQWFRPENVIDVGCGVGAWLEVWKEQPNILEVMGLDARFVHSEFMRVDIDNEFVEVDLNESLPKLKRFDIAVCLEVAEHLKPERAESFVQDLTTLSNIILFSAAIPGQEGTQHINEQFLGYWIKIFLNHGYDCYDVIRPIIWNNKSVAWWFRQNTVLFIKNTLDLDLDLDSMQSFNGFDMVQKDLLKYKERKYYKLVNRKNKVRRVISRIKRIFTKNRQ
ncbi:MAG: methyltransferase domain-containing protein [Bacteroidota bacterium]